MYISAYAKKFYNGELDIQIVDGYFDDDKKILQACQGSDIVGMSGTTPQVPHILHLAKLLKESTQAKIVVGGFGPSLEPFKFLNNENIDHIVVGEGESAFLEILENSPKEETSPQCSRIPKMVSHPAISDINSIPDPDRDAIDLNRYISIAKREEGRRVTSILTERGCAFNCSFCAEGEFGTIWRKATISPGVPGSPEKTSPKINYERATRYRERDPRLVVLEMLEVRDRFGIEFFKMNDAETNPTRAHFINLCKEMVKKKLDVPWGCNMRCDKVDDEICQWAVKARCEEFWMGLESGSPVIQRHINKGTTIPMIREAFRVSKLYCIQRRTYTILGTPPESRETIKETEAFIDEIEPDIIGFSILAPYPGTAYYSEKFQDIDWSKVDEYSNTVWASKYLTNADLQFEQSRLLDKYQDRLAHIVRKKQKLGVIGGGARVLDSAV